MYNQILREGVLPEGWTNGILTLLFKNKGERVDLKNYRPLTIMNVDYKIFTEILMQRLVRALGSAIGQHQSAFLPGRLIDDNVRTIQGIMAKHRGAEDDAAIAFLDQEKAYNRVSHEFLWAALERLGIPARSISWIKLLYTAAKIRIYINGHQSGVIQLRCGVR